uniref:Uncharacterized protein n=1 Tax=Geospiza parvula TaxID=87175 RepID=A0A8U8B0B3_GEOPR
MPLNHGSLGVRAKSRNRNSTKKKVERTAWVAQTSGGLYSLQSATPGGTRMDMETTVDITITDSAVHLVESNVKGPLGGGLSAFLLGRSSAIKRGLDIIPGVIDADYQGVIKIMVRTFFPPVSIPKGSQISQEVITFTFPDGVNITTRSYVMQTPKNLLGLIGRDMLSHNCYAAFLAVVGGQTMVI